MSRSLNVLIVDLNNFARYPSIAIGYLVGVLRRASIDVDVFAPLSIGIKGVTRERKVAPWGLIEQRLRYVTAQSNSHMVRRARARLADWRKSQLRRRSHDVVKQLHVALAACRYDAVLISTYLMYYPLCEEMCAVCEAQGIPVLIGGPYFNERTTAAEWLSIDGCTAVVGGEVDLVLPDIVHKLAAKQALQGLPGLWTESGQACIDAPPLHNLDDIPFPDYTDFPWPRYPNKIIPVLTGRGCAWGACTFCSDVTSTAGRTYRSRSPRNILDELAYQSRRHETNLFAFTDLKLNSDTQVWNALLETLQSTVPGSRWIGAVHVGAMRANGLSDAALHAARQAGIVRLTTGLESGSQRVLDLMAKGTRVEENSRFVHAAHRAGISVRATMIVGYPGETAEDAASSAGFLESHIEDIDRVMVNRFQLILGTRIHRRLERNAASMPQLVALTVNAREAQLDHRNTGAKASAYRKSVSRLLRAAHVINRKSLNDQARDFEGVM